MKQMTRLQTAVSGLITIVLALAPGTVRAAEVPPSIPLLAPILITEVQAGSTTSASEEFIELYNTTSQAIDLSAGNWQLQIASSTATTWDSPLRTISLSGILAGGHHYVVASQYSSAGQTVQYLPAAAGQWFSAGISASAGHVRLIYTIDLLQPDASCVTTGVVDDQFEWSAPQAGVAAVPSITGRNSFVTSKSTGLPAGTSLQRLIDPASRQYIDTDNDATDFTIGTTPSPAQPNVPVASSSPLSTAWQAVPQFTSDQLCDAALPASQGSGNTTSASGGQSILQPPAESPPSLDPNPNSGPSTGDGGIVLGDTTSQPPPTIAIPAIPTIDQGLLAPQISELLPNPAPPQTDAADEFIELYNPNSSPFDLSNFVLASGVDTVHSYVFPVGTMLEPQSFKAFFSPETKLALSNSGGQVALLDPAGNSISKSEPYGAAKDDQAWVFASGTWQWTTLPTPNAVDIVRAPALPVTIKKGVVPATSATKKALPAAVNSSKTTAVKGAKTVASKSKTASPAKVTALKTTAAISPSSPLHPSILAGAAVLAVLYGAYEYRTDLANRIHHFRYNRAARRAARASPKGR